MVILVKGRSMVLEFIPSAWSVRRIGVLSLWLSLSIHVVCNISICTKQILSVSFVVLLALHYILII